MIIDILLGAVIGWFVGLLAGGVIAFNSRDGIWPDVWAWIAIFCALIGAVLGAVDGAI